MMVVDLCRRNKCNLELPDNLAPLVTQTRREDLDSPKFQGTKTNVAFDATTNT